MATLTPIVPARSDVELAGVAAAAGGDEWVNDGSELLLIEHTNAGGADATLTIVTQKTVDGEAVADKTVAIVKGKRYIIGPFPTGYYNDANSKVQITYSSETDLEVAVIDAA